MKTDAQGLIDLYLRELERELAHSPVPAGARSWTTYARTSPMRVTTQSI